MKTRHRSCEDDAATLLAILRNIPSTEPPSHRPNPTPPSHALKKNQNTLSNYTPRTFLVIHGGIHRGMRV